MVVTTYLDEKLQLVARIHMLRIHMQFVCMQPSLLARAGQPALELSACKSSACLTSCKASEIDVAESHSLLVLGQSTSAESMQGLA